MATCVRPMLLMAISRWDASLSGAVFAAWKRFCHERQTWRNGEAWSEERQGQDQANQAELESFRRQLTATQKQNVDLSEQLQQAITYAVELEHEEQVVARREAWLQTRLRDADRCLKQLDRIGLLALDNSSSI